MTASSVARIFLGWDSPALPRAARILAEHYGADGALDLRRVVLVLPAARAGRRLAELILDEAEGRGLRLTPPNLVTMGRFPELLYRSDRPAADRATARHAYAHALRRTDPEYLEAVFPSLPRGVAGWMALAGVVEALHRETGAEGWDFSGISRAFRAGFPYDDTVRWEVLAWVQNRYHAILEEAGLGDLDRERSAALEEGRLTDPGDVWLVGVVELPKVVFRMVEALPGTVRALIHAPEEVADRFDSIGCLLTEGWEAVRSPLEDHQIRVVHRPPDQAKAVQEILAGFGDRFSAEEVVVGVPDPELVPYLERGLAMAGVPHRFAGGTPIRAVGPVPFLQALADFLLNQSFQGFASLVRHPDLTPLVDSLGPEADVTGPVGILDRFQTEHFQAVVEDRVPGGDKSAAEMRRLVARVEEVLALTTFRDRRRVSEWMPRILDVLVRVYGTEPLDPSKRRVRHLVEASTRIRDAAARLMALPPALDEEVDAPDALAALLADLKNETIPPDPEEEAVELLGWLELPLDDAPAVVLTGVNDRTLPESVGSDPFLPGSLRSHLGIPDDRSRYARDAYLLSALLHSREEVHLVAGRTNAARDPLRLSRLLFSAGPEEMARRLIRFLEDEEPPPERVFTQGSSPASSDPPRRGSRFLAPPQDPIICPEAPTRIRVTDFAAILQDPYRYALERTLGLGPLDDQARELDGMAFGSLAHLVLERFGTSPEVASSDAEAVEKKLSRLLDGAVHEKFGRSPVPAVRVQTEQLRTRLRDFAQWQAAWIESGWKVVCVEQQPDPGVAFVVDGEAIQLRGKIDRIDRNERTGEWAVLDYKTSDLGRTPEETHRKGKGKNTRWVDLQLPLYRTLLVGVTDEAGAPVIPIDQQPSVRLGYILLPRKRKGVKVTLGDWSGAELADAEETAREVVRGLRKGEFRYDAGTPRYRNDPFDALLGRTLLPLTREEEGGGES